METIMRLWFVFMSLNNKVVMAIAKPVIHILQGTILDKKLRMKMF